MTFREGRLLVDELSMCIGRIHLEMILSRPYFLHLPIRQVYLSPRITRHGDVPYKPSILSLPLTFHYSVRRPVSRIHTPRHSNSRAHHHCPEPGRSGRDT